MGRTSRNRPDRFRPPPVERIELNEEHLGRRLLIAGVFLVVGAVLITFSLVRFLTPASGWQTIQANGTGEPSCAADFTFLYEAASSEDAKDAAARYTEACQRAYRLFLCQEGFEGVVNVYTINHRPNEVLMVDPALYAALSTAVEGGRRELYLGPVYSRWNDLFFCQEDGQLAFYDPRISEDVAREYREVLSFANAPEAVDLELLEGNQVYLRVSEDYLAYAEREGIDRFLDFGWMKNAFVADLVAEELTAGGITQGVLSSFDGFTRNLDGREGTYDYPLHHRRDGAVWLAGNLRYQGPKSLVCLRDFAANERDMERFYTLQNGEVRTPYLDTADALCKNALSSLVCYDRERTCGQLLMEMLPVYIADGPFGSEDAAALADRGVEAVFCQGTVVYYTDEQAVLTDLMDLTEEGGVRYTAELVRP